MCSRHHTSPLNSMFAGATAATEVVQAGGPAYSRTTRRSTRCGSRTRRRERFVPTRVHQSRGPRTEWLRRVPAGAAHGRCSPAPRAASGPPASRTTGSAGCAGAQCRRTVLDRSLFAARGRQIGVSAWYQTASSIQVGVDVSGAEADRSRALGSASSERRPAGRQRVGDRGLRLAAGRDRLSGRSLGSVFTVPQPRSCARSRTWKSPARYRRHR